MRNLSNPEAVPLQERQQNPDRLPRIPSAARVPQSVEASSPRRSDRSAEFVRTKEENQMIKQL